MGYFNLDEKRKYHNSYSNKAYFEQLIEVFGNLEMEQLVDFETWSRLIYGVWRTSTLDHEYVNFQQNFNDRNKYVQINDVSRLLIGRNNIINKLKCLNNFTDYDWLNQSLNTFKTKSKK